MLISDIRIESTGFLSFKRMTIEGKAIGFASQLTNEKWIATDLDGNRISGEQFHTPNKVRRWFFARETNRIGSK